MSAKSVSFDPQPCRHRNSGRFGAALLPPREYCTCVICSGSPNRPGTTFDSRPISAVSSCSLLLASFSIASLIPSQYSVRLWRGKDRGTDRGTVVGTGFGKRLEQRRKDVRKSVRKDRGKASGKTAEKRRPRWDWPPGRERREKKKGFNFRELRGSRSACGADNSYINIRF